VNKGGGLGRQNVEVVSGGTTKSGGWSCPTNSRASPVRTGWADCNGAQQGRQDNVRLVKSAGGVQGQRVLSAAATGDRSRSCLGRGFGARPWSSL